MSSLLQLLRGEIDKFTTKATREKEILGQPRVFGATESPIARLLRVNPTGQKFAQTMPGKVVKALVSPAEEVRLAEEKLNSGENLSPEEVKLLKNENMTAVFGLASGSGVKNLTGSVARRELGGVALSKTNKELRASGQAVEESIALSQKFVKEMSREARKKFLTYTPNPLPETNLNIAVERLADIGETRKGWGDPQRIFEKVFGDQYSLVKSKLLDPFDASKGSFVDFQNKWADDLEQNVVKGLGIKKGSKMSAAVQLYGEGKINYVDLVNKFGEDKALKIKQADDWFRGTYDKLIDEVNGVRKAIYPYAPEMWVGKRKDYYRHFREQSGLSGLKNIFENPAGIDPTLVGVSDFTTPRAKWLAFAQHRTGDSSKMDAVGGFLDYLPKAGYAINIDPHIEKFRGLQKELAIATADPQNKFTYKRLNNFVEFLEDYANDLSGKTNPLDRGIQKYVPGGRKTFKAIDWMNKRVKANTILGNASSTVAQIFNVPQGIAATGEKNFLAGTIDTVLSPIKKTPIDGSSFIKERYFKMDQFDTGAINNIKKFAVWMTGVLDEFGTKSIWHSAYHKGQSEGVENAVKYADDMTRKLVAGRGIGEVPIVQKSKLLQLVAPFQLEVANLWWVMKDQVDAKQFGALAKLAVYNYLFNSASEKIMGRRVTFDPIDALIDAATDEEKSPLKAAGRVAGEVLSNVPLGQSVAAAYPEQGFSVAGKDAPTREELFGESDPTRFGSGGLVVKGIQDPLYKLLFPFGGGQVKKTVEGAKAYSEGASKTKTGRVRFPVEKNAKSLLQMLLFGQYSTPEAREYFKSKDQPLGEKQSELFNILGASVYKNVKRDRDMKANVIKRLKKTDVYKNAGSEKRKQLEAMVTAKL